MASLEVDLSNIEPGNTITVKWRGKPVFVKHRTEEEIGKAKDEDISKLRDPQADDDRTQKPEVRPAFMCNQSPPSSMLMSWAIENITAWEVMALYMHKLMQTPSS